MSLTFDYLSNQVVVSPDPHQRRVLERAWHLQTATLVHSGSLHDCTEEGAPVSECFIAHPEACVRPSSRRWPREPKPSTTKRLLSEGKLQVRMRFWTPAARAKRPPSRQGDTLRALADAVKPADARALVASHAARLFCERRMQRVLGRNLLAIPVVFAPRAVSVVEPGGALFAAALRDQDDPYVQQAARPRRNGDLASVGRGSMRRTGPVHSRHPCVWRRSWHSARKDRFNGMQLLSAAS
ncbi:hypothetical protein GY45DRAFT_98036 [Cubamyces sp. BRFM 1775]|nr:hypothetical protein GY45DRAFT_98036 [Cubamyces sp. BRFM 1775]